MSSPIFLSSKPYVDPQTTSSLLLLNPTPQAGPQNLRRPALRSASLAAVAPSGMSKNSSCAWVSLSCRGLVYRKFNESVGACSAWGLEACCSICLRGKFRVLIGVTAEIVSYSSRGIMARFLHNVTEATDVDVQRVRADGSMESRRPEGYFRASSAEV